MKVKVISTFIGSPEEVEQYGGQVPDTLKKFENRMSQGERDSFAGKINSGTTMEVTEKRAHELASKGLVELPGKEKETTTGKKK